MQQLPGRILQARSVWGVLLVPPRPAPCICNKCEKTSNQPSTTWKHKLGHGFSSNSHHGPESSGGTAAADNERHTTAEAATATSTTVKHDDVPAHEFEHVKNEGLSKNQYRRKKNKLLKQKNNVIFNSSDLVLTKPMECVLNKGLKFAILPLRLDITQVLTDFRRHERSMVWKEFFYGKENDIPYKPPMFKQKKHNFPQKHRAPKGLYDYLAAVQSDILDPKNRNKVTSNISNEEKEALKELIKLQRERKIVIKPCDKGAGIIILNFKEYIKACMDHLEAKTSTGENYYKEVDDNKLLEAKEKITNIVKEGFDNDILSKEEFSAMLPHADEAPIAGRFYCTFKVHKEYEHGKAPPPRGIVS